MIIKAIHMDDEGMPAQIDVRLTIEELDLIGFYSTTVAPSDLETVTGSTEAVTANQALCDGVSDVFNRYWDDGRRGMYAGARGSVYGLHAAKVERETR